jgi:hypothetical protein
MALGNSPEDVKRVAGPVALQYEYARPFGIIRIIFDNHTLSDAFQNIACENIIGRQFVISML